GAVGLLEIPPRRQRRAAIEDTDIVEPEKPALVEIVAGAVLAVHPPAIIGAELAKDPLQKIEVGSTAQRLLHTEQKNCRPSLHRGVDVAEVPLVGPHL